MRNIKGGQGWWYLSQNELESMQVVNYEEQRTLALPSITGGEAEERARSPT